MNVKLLRFFDRYIMGFFILILFWLKYFFLGKKEKIIHRPQKILIIRLWALGSSILTFPMIKQLEDYYGKDVQYDLLASSRNMGVFKHQGYFHAIYNLFSWKDIFNLLCGFKTYDIVVDAEEYFFVSALFALWTGKITIGYTNICVRNLAYNCGIMYNDKQHSLLTALDLIQNIGVPCVIPQRMEPLKYSDKDTRKVDTFLSEIPGKLICMHTGGAETAKERAWPTHKRVALIKELIKKHDDILIILSGTHFEKQVVQTIVDSLDDMESKKVKNICGMFNLYEFAYLLQKCTLMISNDTGPMHLGAAMGVKTIGLFGPELPNKFGPWPLDKNVGLYKGDGNACIKVHLAIWRKDTHYWVDKITVDDVLAHLHSL
ncbi:MAG: glycosyltransferase family 9 protein [candidate division SR1 bacterium]|nr:glycosyltransferase family 9 protein [candidate division SR1 bacterium]